MVGVGIDIGIGDVGVGDVGVGVGVVVVVAAAAVVVVAVAVGIISVVFVVDVVIVIVFHAVIEVVAAAVIAVFVADKGFTDCEYVIRCQSFSSRWLGRTEHASFKSIARIHSIVPTNERCYPNLDLVTSQCLDLESTKDWFHFYVIG